MKRGLIVPGRSGPLIVCEISVKSEYWFERYCRAKISAVFGIFHTHVIFKKIFFQVKNFFLGVKNHMLKKKIWGQKFSGKLNFGFDLGNDYRLELQFN